MPGAMQRAVTSEVVATVLHAVASLQHGAEQLNGERGAKQTPGKSKSQTV